LFVFMFLGGVAQTFDVPLRQTLVFVLVPRHLAPNALALVQTGWGLMRSLGPAIGGFLIAWFGPGGNFLVQAGVYSLVALNVLRIQFPPRESTLKAGEPFWSNLKAGIDYVRREPTTRTFLVMGWVLPLFIIPNFLALPPIYAKETFEGGPEALGVLLASVGVGGIFGGLVTASLGGVDRRGLVQIGALALLSLSLIAFALAPEFELACVCFARAGFFELIFLTGNQTLLQLSIPDDLRGRVTSITTLTMGLSPIGAVYAGVSADFFGPETVTIVLASLAGLVALITFLFVPTVRDYSIRKAIAEHVRIAGANVA
jgi:predicted MFS family arabinose efflux permease